MIRNFLVYAFKYCIKKGEIFQGEKKSFSNKSCFSQKWLDKFPKIV